MDLRKQLRSLNDKSEQFYCPNCGEDFTEKISLRKHYCNHNKNKCDQCGKFCASNVALKIHYRKHTDEKPYERKQCEKVVSQKSNLKTHLGRKCDCTLSTKELYKCHLCPKSYKDKPDFIEHIICHPYKDCIQCQLCECFFTNEAQAKNHFCNTDEKFDKQCNKLSVPAFIMLQRLASCNFNNSNLEISHNFKNFDALFITANDLLNEIVMCYIKKMSSFHDKIIVDEECNKYFCIFCGVTYLTKSELDHHIMYINWVKSKKERSFEIKI